MNLVGEEVAGKAGRMTATDSVRFVSKHINLTSAADRQNQIVECLKEFHQEGTTEERKKELSDIIILATWHLFPYILRNRNLQSEVFEEAIQNMVVQTLRAIENFNPEYNYKFHTYISGYLKAALSDTLKSTYIVSKPSNVHNKQIRELREAARQGCPQAIQMLREMLAEESTKEESKSTKEVSKNDIDTLSDTNKSKTGYLRELTTDLESLTGVFLEEVDYTEASGFASTDPMEKKIYRKEILDILERVLTKEGAGVYAHDFDVLNLKEKMVLCCRYGVFSASNGTLEDVRDRFHQIGWEASKEWIHQIEKKAKHKLRIFFEEEYGITDTKFFEEE
jgi:DNA-directed RNA polymerase sigma subunit (sigma70/sigma32)